MSRAWKRPTMDEALAHILDEYRRCARGNHESVAHLADLSGIPYSTLQRILNPDDHYTLGINLLIPFMEAVGEYSLIDHIEMRLGRVAIPVKANAIGLNGAGMCRFAREAGEAMRALGTALEDGRITPAEARECRIEVTHLLQVLTGLLAALDAIESKQEAKS